MELHLKYFCLSQRQSLGTRQNKHNLVQPSFISPIPVGRIPRNILGLHSIEAASEFAQLSKVATNVQGLPRSNRILFLWFCKCFGEGNKPRQKLVTPAHSDPNSNLITAVRKASRKLLVVLLFVQVAVIETQYLKIPEKLTIEIHYHNLNVQEW